MTISGAEKASPANSASTKPMTPPASNLQSAALPLGPVGLGCRGAVDLGLEKRLFAGVRWLWRTAALRRVLLNGPTKDESWYQTDTGSLITADDFSDRASAVSVGHSRYQNGGYPRGSRIVKALVTDAAPAVAGIRDPAKIKNLLRLDR